MMIQELINLKNVAHINIPKLPHDVIPGKKTHLYRSFNILLTEN